MLRPTVADGESCFYVRIEAEQHETTGKRDSFRTGPALSRMDKPLVITASSCVQIESSFAPCLLVSRDGSNESITPKATEAAWLNGKNVTDYGKSRKNS